MDQRSDSGFAVIRHGGRQFRVSVGDRVVVDRVSGTVGEIVNFDEVLLVSSGDSTIVGSPLVGGAKVKAKILSNDRAKKVIIFKKKRRTGYTKKQGHRQNITRLVIEDIQAGL
ncbi:MAG: 50S ribosomal protein L21 [Proteobacteria bacterium]|nr:MAG: 50S ribosomal protein L21 [Pseudomonadota bacterium]